MTKHELNASKLSQITNLVDLSLCQASYYRDKIAYSFLKDGETLERQITYLELDTHFRKIANYLQTRQLSDKRILLLMPSSISFIEAFFGCIYASAIAVPANLSKPGRNSWKRLESIAADSEAKVILTTRATLPSLMQYSSTSSILKELECIAVEDLLETHSPSKELPKLSSESIAFLQYTSGSTTNPKGVMVTHGNLLHNQKIVQATTLTNSNSTFVSWLPLFHDLGLIGSVLQSFYVGAHCYLMTPLAFLQKPFRWLKAISDYQATVTHAPNFAYELCIDKIAEEEKKQLNLSSWKVALNGAEPVRAKTLVAFSEKFATCGFDKETFFPAYGLAEATLVVTGGAYNDKTIKSFDPEMLKNNLVLSSTEQNRKWLVSCGKTLGDQKIKIVDPLTKSLCDPSRVGEVWISGSSIAKGYWNNTSATQEIFQAYIQNSGEGPFLRTGDLGFLYEDHIFITGRAKDLIIINGRNYYPQDIEYTVQESALGLKKGGCAVFSTDIQEREQVVVVQEVERSYLDKVNHDELTRIIKKAVFLEHELDVYKIVLIKPDTLPKTSSGKVQRKVCCKEFLENSLELIPNLLSLSSTTPVNTKNVDVESEKTEELILWLREYASTRINSRVMDERRSLSPHIILDFGNRGLLGMQVPPNYGGLGLNHTNSNKILEQLGAIDQSLALLVLLNNSLGIRPILNYGSSSVKDNYLPLLASGRELAAFALTETVAGSNPRAIKSTAKPLKNGAWFIEGKKIWSGSAAWSGFINVFVRQLDENGLPNGISGFVIPQGIKGIRQGPEALTMGMRGMIQNTIFLEGVEIDSKHVLGTLTSGLDVAQDAMTYCRLGIGAFALGAMKRCAQLMHRYAERRTISTGVLLKNPVSLTVISEVLAAIFALESLIYKTSELLDQGYTVPVDVYSAAKIAGAELLWDAADSLMQILGGRGYIESNIAPQIMRDARILRIFEGPTETLCMFLGSRVLNKTEEIQSFFSLLKNSASIFNKLKEAAFEIQENASKSKRFSDQATALQWAQYRIGEATVYALLQACLEDAHSKNPSMETQRATFWAHQKFEQKIASSLMPKEVLFNDKVITDFVTTYKNSIGDIEQGLPTEEQLIDEMLRSKTHISTPAPQIVSDVKLTYTTDETIEKIQDKLILWIANNLNIPHSSVHKEVSFSDIGLDSISAVNLSQAIHEIWNIEVDPTIAWDFPTIIELSKYLTFEIEQKEHTHTDEQNNLSGQSNSYLNLITEEEAKTLLSEELRKLNGRTFTH